MNYLDWTQLAFYFAVLLGLTPVLGGWMARIYAGGKHFLQRPLGWLEKLFYRYADRALKAGYGYNSSRDQTSQRPLCATWHAYYRVCCQ